MRVFNKIILLALLLVAQLSHAEVYEIDKSFANIGNYPGFLSHAIKRPHTIVKVEQQGDKIYLLANIESPINNNAILYRFNLDGSLDKVLNNNNWVVTLDVTGNNDKAQDLHFLTGAMGKVEKIIVSGISTTPAGVHRMFLSILTLVGDGGVFNATNTFPIGNLTGNKNVPMQTQVIALANRILIATYYVDGNGTKMGVYGVKYDSLVDNTFGNNGLFSFHYNQEMQNLNELIFHSGHLYMIGEDKGVNQNNQDVVIMHLIPDNNTLKLFTNNNTEGFWHINQGQDKFVAAQISSDNQLLLATTAINNVGEIKLFLGKHDANILFPMNPFIDGQFTKQVSNDPIAAMAITEKGGHVFAMNTNDKKRLFSIQESGSIDAQFGPDNGFLNMAFPSDISGMTTYKTYNKQLYVFATNFDVNTSSGRIYLGRLVRKDYPDLKVEKMNNQNNPIALGVQDTLQLQLTLTNVGDADAGATTFKIEVPDGSILLPDQNNNLALANCAPVNATMVECPFDKFLNGDNKPISLSYTFTKGFSSALHISLLTKPGDELKIDNNEVTYQLEVTAPPPAAPPPPPGPANVDFSITTIEPNIEAKLGDTKKTPITVVNLAQNLPQKMLSFTMSISQGKIIDVINDVIPNNCNINPENSVKCEFPNGAMPTPLEIPLKFNFVGNYTLTYTIATEDIDQDITNNLLVQNVHVVDPNQPVVPPPPPPLPTPTPTVDPKLKVEPVKPADPSNPTVFIDDGAVTDNPVTVTGAEQKTNTVTPDGSGGKSGCNLQHQQNSQFNFTQFIYLGFVLMFLGVMRKKMLS